MALPSAFANTVASFTESPQESTRLATTTLGKEVGTLTPLPTVVATNAICWGVKQVAATGVVARSLAKTVPVGAPTSSTSASWAPPEENVLRIVPRNIPAVSPAVFTEARTVMGPEAVVPPVGLMVNQPPPVVVEATDETVRIPPPPFDIVRSCGLGEGPP